MTLAYPDRLPRPGRRPVSGVFYVLQLLPDIAPGRLKMGWTANLRSRLEDHRCTSPQLVALGTWPCHTKWEQSAITQLTAGARRVGPEVFDVADTARLVREAEWFFRYADRTVPPAAGDRNSPGEGVVRVGVDEYLPLPQAALRLGISPSALRRRVRAGTAQGETRPSSGGFTWYVRCPPAAPTPTDSPGEPAGDPAPTPEVRALAVELATAQEAVRRLEAHCASLTEELAARRREVQELHAMMGMVTRALPAPAPLVATSTNGIAHGQAVEASAAPETQSAPPARDPAGRQGWWPRLSAWLSGAPAG